MTKLKKISILLNVFLISGLFVRPAFALEPVDEYPSLMWGPVTVIENPGTDQELTIYSQEEGSEIIRNVAATSENSPDLKFNIGRFVLSGLFSGSLKLLSSQTTVNGGVKASTAILRIRGVNIFGDSANSSSSYNYWGQHLSQNSGSTNAFWQLPNYQFNPSAQAYFAAKNNYAMNSTLARLMQNAKGLSSGSTHSLPGQFDGICYPNFIADFSSSDVCPELNQYSDGRVWYSTGSVKISGGVTYLNKATVIVENGDLTIDGSIAASADDKTSSLGFIVQNGNVVIENTTNKLKNIDVSIFAPKGTITIGTQTANSGWISGNNINLTGSFIANDFSVHGSAINFIQDTRDESVWPPGFRDLLPLSVTSK